MSPAICQELKIIIMVFITLIKNNIKYTYSLQFFTFLSNSFHVFLQFFSILSIFSYNSFHFFLTILFNPFHFFNSFQFFPFFLTILFNSFQAFSILSIFSCNSFQFFPILLSIPKNCPKIEEYEKNCQKRIEELPKTFEN